MALAVLTAARLRLTRWLGNGGDEVALRLLLALIVVIAIGALAVDFRELNAAPSDAPNVVSYPSADRPEPATIPRTSGPTVPLPRFDERLRAPMTFELAAGGRLLATGTIVPGTSAQFAAEVAKRGSYVTTVVLASPGGAVADAMAMGRLIREKKFGTEVESGHYCASSCPLVFAGGVVRRASLRAAIGVHQVSATGAIALPTGDGMQDAQIVSAVCQRYLREMGVDLEVWLHAMETPSDRLFYFQPNEMLKLKLATDIDGLSTPDHAGLSRGQ
jgi:hypothetical protein